MKHILILLVMIFFIGCKQEATTVENKPSEYEWNLEYFHKVKFQNEELYECVYVGIKRAFSILSNTECKEKL